MQAFTGSLLLFTCLVVGLSLCQSVEGRTPELRIELPMNSDSEEGRLQEVELTSDDLTEAGVPSPLAAAMGGRVVGYCITICRFGHCRGICRIPVE